MIGDWVMCTYPSINKPVRVEEIRTISDRELHVMIFDDVRLAFTSRDIEPIPITKEILEKNGFEKVEETECSCSYCTLIPTGYEKSSYTCKFNFYKEPIMGVSTLLKCWGQIPPQNGGMNDIHICNLKNLHQLQHLLRICNIEKEWKL